MCFGRSLSADEWAQLFRFAHSQGVTGLFIDGVAQGEMRPDDELWAKWIAHLLYLERANRYIAIRGEAWVKRLGDVGISASVFKGSSVGAWYPEPLHRSHGDIDIVISEGWDNLVSVLSQEEWETYRSDEDEIILEEKHRLLVEFHRRWEYLYNPWANRRLQQWCRNSKPLDNELYLVCLILHIQRHFLTYGIGLKQVCDVALMLRRVSLDRGRVAYLLRSLHAERFSRLLFGFIALHLGGVEVFPLSPLKSGKGLELLNDVILREGYNSKMEQELVSGSKSRAMTRIVSNATFWTKRCYRVFSIMPGEACCFLLYKVIERLKKLVKIKHS
jgi:hypothetical protein